MPVRIIPHTSTDYKRIESSDEGDGIFPIDYVRVKVPAAKPSRVVIEVTTPCDIRKLDLRSFGTTDAYRKKYGLNGLQYRSMYVRGISASAVLIFDDEVLNPMVDSFIAAQLDLPIPGIFVMIDRIDEIGSWITPLLRIWQANANMLPPPRKSSRNRSSMFE